MRVTVRLFAMLREAARTDVWSCDVPAGSSVADVWRALVAVHPGLTRFDGAISSAVGEDFARMDAVLREGDEVAFLPPVSGGAE